jgi:hypothetical protein
MNQRTKRIAFVALCVCLPLAALALVEGISSFALFALSLRNVDLAEVAHTERDSLLGWINRPNVSLPNQYGPGVALHTNNQRLRSKEPLADRPPAGRRRVVCVGDSFTLGYGVRDDQTWCALLSASDSSLESVNMGQGGYGLDQAYLWYTRDGRALRPDIDIFAFIGDDFRRMQTTHMMGTPKPQLALDGSRLYATGVPVPAPGVLPVIFRVTTAMRALKSFSLLERITGERTAGSASLDRTTWAVAHAALRDLARRDSAAGITFVAVMLPTSADYMGNGANKWRKQLREAAERKEFQFVDLIEPFRSVRPDSVDAMFIQRGQISYRGATGHYTPKGNAWVAANLRRIVPTLAHE